MGSSGAAGTFASVNAGFNIPVAASGFTLAGSKAIDYSLSQPTGLSANIIPAVITATITGNPTKAYDGSNSATLTNSDYHLSGFVGAQGADGERLRQWSRAGELEHRKVITFRHADGFRLHHVA